MLHLQQLYNEYAESGEMEILEVGSKAEKSDRILGDVHDPSNRSTEPPGSRELRLWILSLLSFFSGRRYKSLG